ncbi:hypothetical protein J2847_006830 [Azospirillum agricola]|uniref:hypothetical protein n=1 Tax=Azospirillum agricola TaxID=1720247 RepID=UPI001F43E530|nr:hypothetical protein [Azospirillum agricola]MBP2233489.1 hypothetical protein [Azospirillum agricola]
MGLEDPAITVALPEVVALDQLTWQAVEDGVVDLPYRRVHGGMWLRLLRTLLDELNVVGKNLGQYRRVVAPIWRAQGLEFRQGFRFHWQPFEEMTSERQVSLLHLAAVAVDLLRNKRIKAAGVHAQLFQRLPISGSDLPSVAQIPSIAEVARKVVAVAQKDPAQAIALYHFLLSVKRTHEHKDKIDRLFLDIGIPLPKEGTPQWIT